MTPLEKLQANKQRLQTACDEQEKKINATFSYIQENAGSLLLSGVSSLLFPSKPSNKADSKPAVTQKDNATNPSPLSTTDILSLGKSLLPVAWDIIQPILISWSIRTAKKKIIGLFTSKKKKADTKDLKNN